MELEGHVDQQQHMSYLLMPFTRHCWLKHGTATDVIRHGREHHIHHSFNCVSINQFHNHVSWQFGALKQALKHHGHALIQAHEKTQDGLLI